MEPPPNSQPHNRKARAMKSTTPVRWVTLDEARQVLEVDEDRFEQIMNDPHFPQINEMADEFLLRLDELERFILRTENTDDPTTQ